MIDNLKLLEYSLRFPEPVIDPFYVKKGTLVISRNPRKPSDLMKISTELVESITAYSFAIKKNNKKTAVQALEEIVNLLKEKNVHFTEFVSFWPVLDISYSLFKRLSKEAQLEVVKRITEKYLEVRHDLYRIYGYSPVTLQVSKDAKAHKESGSPGVKKVSKMLELNGWKKANDESIVTFLKTKRKKFIETDKGGKRLFKEFIEKKKLKFAWSTKRDSKMPDFLFKYKDHVFIVEHKHKKEGGGGQNDQVNEVVSFVGYKERDPKIHFVSFVDGIYFNLFAKKASAKNKIPTQLKNIRKNLTKNKQNYFVNTAGFKKLLQSL